MSLIHWWPLNGDLKDQGCQPVDLVIGAGAQSFSMSGKIGQCASMNGSTYYKAQNVTTGANTTICCWAKTSTQGRMMWGMQCSASELMNFFTSTIYTLNTGDSNNNPFKDENNHSISVISDNQWHHFVVMFKGTENAKLYIDGIYRGQAQIYRNPTMSSKLFTLGTWNHSSYSSYCWNGSLNDVRIYDEALDEKQIKKIAQGLVLHYTMDNCGVKQLPQEYQRVEYIRFDKGYGTYIELPDIKLVCNSMRMEMTIMPNSFYDYNSLWCSSANSDSDESWFYGNRRLAMRINNTQPYLTHPYFESNNNPNQLVDIIYDIKEEQPDKARLYINDTYVQVNFTDALNRNYSIGIGGYNGNTAADYSLYKLKIIQNHKTVYDAVPCYRKSDGKPGLYDFVTNQFFTNSGSGEFLLGPSVGLPNGYQQVEYIESTNTNASNLQYISTNIQWMSIKKIHQIAEVTRFSSANHCMLYRNNQLASQWFSLDSPNKYQSGATAGVTLSNTATNWLNNKTNLLLNVASTSNTNKFEIGAWQDTIWSGGWKNYSTRVFSSTSVISDLIPCYRKSDGKPGMYDVINSVFCVNQQTGDDFAVGGKLHLFSEMTTIKKTNQLFNYAKNYTQISRGITLEYDASTRVYHAYGTCEDWSGKYATFYPYFDDASKTSMAGHKYAFIIKSISEPSNKMVLSGLQGVTVSYLYNNINQIQIYNVTNAAELRPYINVLGWAAGKSYDHYFKLAFVDLTDMFSSGSEPTDLDQVKAKCPHILECEDFTPLGSTKPEPYRDDFSWNGAIERDISGYHYDGTKVNKPILSETSPRYRLSTRFGQSSVKNHIRNSMGLTNTEEFSLMAWVFPYARNTGWDRDCIIIGGCYLTIARNGTISAYCAGKSPAGYIDGTNTVPLNTWSHIAIVYSASTLRMYLNGELDKEIGCTGTMHSGYNYKYIGCEGSDRQFDGNISDVRIYATALSADDIAEIYNQKKEGY